MNFRFPAELKLRLEEAARSNGRTLTAEIVHRLRESFVLSDAGGAIEDDYVGRLREIERDLLHMREVVLALQMAADGDNASNEPKSGSGSGKDSRETPAKQKRRSPSSVGGA